MSHIQDIELPDGTVITARIGAADAYDDQEDVGFTEAAVAKLDQLQELIKGVGGTVLTAAREARPHEAAITFGVELTAKEGVAVAVLARGEVKASLQVTLTWQFDGTTAGEADESAAAHE
ncbi:MULTISPECIES: CU044_2847 family protein [unclassified Streptomyces]|uniref:CU044_2847 family protein n=1 Tax=unclassified Streptomyces TaxID=2593676 RepID=UPI0023656701|nr:MULTISPECIES: CU044_2847 family protein [unclassified Streptomyces]MDF3148641.1 CU044_2847 family protein [Streptomyces sp. T21Q-yed]WDF41196.1 CU044_2847 family protein [Streptomyces sp. T12]